jgi:hypothetical protein
MLRCPACQVAMIVPDGLDELTEVAPRAPLADEDEARYRSGRDLRRRPREDDRDDRRRRRDVDDDRRDRRPRRAGGRGDWNNCPECGADDGERVLFTFWGGWLEAFFMSTVKCRDCGTQYNRRKGDVYTLRILLMVLGLVFGLVSGLLTCVISIAMHFIK